MNGCGPEAPRPGPPGPGASAAIALAARGISKTFGGAKALDRVDLVLRVGEVHGLLGQNGSGKSTLIKILAGYHAPDPGGTLTIFGESLGLPLPARDARAQGLAFVHQHLGLIASLSVLENLRIGDFATAPHWRIDWRAERAKARALFDRFDLALDPDRLVGDLAEVERALLAIVRAFEEVTRAQEERGGGILVLDEPTPFLPKAGVERLFKLVRGIVKAGASVVFVSHDIDEVRQLTDRCTVLRDGKPAGTIETRVASRDDIVERIIGRKAAAYRIVPAARTGETAGGIRVEGLRGGSVAGLSLALAPGEIVGLAGLIGSGFSDPPYLLFGAPPPGSVRSGDAPASEGTLAIGGRTHRLAGLDPAAAQRLGLALLPADRLGAAGVGALPVGDNITLPVLGAFRGRFGLDRAGLLREALRLGAAHDVRPNDPGLPLEALSGGNQQKVLLAKWLQCGPRLLLLDEPTQGVDIGARQQIYAALDAAARAGTAILVASSDFEQLAAIAARVLVFAKGVVVVELVGAEITKERIAEACYAAAPGAGASNPEVPPPPRKAA